MPVLEKTFSKDLFRVKYQVEEDQDGQRLDQFLQNYMPSFSRQQIKTKISNGDIVIEGRPGKHKPSSKLHHNDIVIMVTRNEGHEDEYWHGEKLALQLVPEVLFEDEDLIVIAKPPYMSTHPTGKHLFNCATVYFESKYNKTIHSIHRLDRETSGVLLLGKEPNATAKITSLFEEDKVRKCYFWIAKIGKNFSGKTEFVANERLGSPYEGRKRVIVEAFNESSSEGKEAQTSFLILFFNTEYAYGLAFPKTGRQHQIRVHAKEHGLPLLGDKLYLGGYPMFQRFKDNIPKEKDFSEMELSRHALHAVGLNIEYKNERKTFVSPIPDDLKEWLNKKLNVNMKELESEINKRIDDYFKKVFK